MTASLDLDAIHLDRIRTEAERGCPPTKRDTFALLAEVERLRADSVPRSALVQVGWARPNRGRHSGLVPWLLTLMDSDTEPPPRPGDQPAFIIREDADA